MSDSSPAGGPSAGEPTPGLPVAVDDAGAVEVVRRQLDAHPVSREDADPEAAHLAGDVPEHHVIVVELHAEHRVRQGLDDLALELDFFLFGHLRRYGSAPARVPTAARRRRRESAWPAARWTAA